MAHCAYCGSEGVMTREHLFPAWRQDAGRRKNLPKFLERSRSKIVGSSAVVRDVCATCNNGTLSQLDAYAKSLYEEYFSKPAWETTAVRFAYSYEMLVRWLLKISYNSARVHNSDQSILGSHARAVLGLDPISTDVHAFVRLVAAAVVTPQKDFFAAIGPDDPRGSVSIPEGFRMGPFRFPDCIVSNYYALRHVAVSSMSFFLFVPDLRPSASPAPWAPIKKACESNDGFGVELSPLTGEVAILPPVTDHMHAHLGHFLHNPTTYGVVSRDIAGDFQRGTKAVLLYEIKRDDISQGELGVLLVVQDLKEFILTRESILRVRNAIEISVQGYETDPRVLWLIPEVRDFLQKLNSMFPFWGILQHPAGMWLRALALTLCSQTPADSTSYAVNSRQLEDLVRSWHDGVDEVCRRTALPSEAKQEAIDTIRQVLQGSENARTQD